MKVKKCRVLATAAILISGLTILATSVDSVEELNPQENLSYLAGLNGIYVQVESLKQDAKKFGLTEQALQTDVEARLRLNGIKILSQEQWSQTPGQPSLHIEVNVQLREQQQIAAMNLSVKCKQDVLLKRDPNIVCTGVTTWQRSDVTLTRVGFVKKVHENIGNYVDEFINDYFAANPRLKNQTQKPAENHLEDLDPKDKMWVKCTSQYCGAEYEMAKKEYQKIIRQQVNSGKGFEISIVCKQCGQGIIQKAVKCPKCEKVFLYGAMGRGSFADKCPSCKFSETEDKRKSRKKN
ncbi:MAG: hypothetical protein ACYS0I_05860 [Planctomycetota bacterium]|jgi:phage FluMu protein Com